MPPMSEIFESESFVLPADVKKDVEFRLKQLKPVKSVELLMNGDNVTEAKEFGLILSALKKRGVRISHQFSIKLEFPRGISREETLELVERMPKPVNGSLKVRLQMGDKK